MAEADHDPAQILQIESEKLEMDFELAEKLIKIKEYGLFMYDSGSITMNKKRLPCTLFYLGSLSDKNVRNRGSNKSNIELDISQFGLDKKELEWRPYHNEK